MNDPSKRYVYRDELTGDLLYRRYVPPRVMSDTAKSIIAKTTDVATILGSIYAIISGAVGAYKIGLTSGKALLRQKGYRMVGKALEYGAKEFSKAKVGTAIAGGVMELAQVFMEKSVGDIIADTAEVFYEGGGWVTGHCPPLSMDYMSPYTNDDIIYIDPADRPASPLPTTPPVLSRPVSPMPAPAPIPLN